MTLDRDEIKRLMAYVDGELDAEEAAEVECLLDLSEEARSLVEALRRLDRSLGDGDATGAPPGDPTDRGG